MAISPNSIYIIQRSADGTVWEETYSSGSDALLQTDSSGKVVLRQVLPSGVIIPSSSHAINADFSLASLTSISASYASHAQSADYAEIATSASFSQNTIHAVVADSSTSASYATVSSTTTSASYALRATSANYSTTAVHAGTATLANTASYVDFANVKNTPTLVSSSNQILIGSNVVSESTQFTGLSNFDVGEVSASFYGNLTGTASYADLADTASYVEFSGIENKPTLVSESAQILVNSGIVSESTQFTVESNFNVGSVTASGGLLGTASYADVAGTASYVKFIDVADKPTFVNSFAGRTGSVVPVLGDYSASMIGLGEVDNTSDADKPISIATQTALDLKVGKDAGGNAESLNSIQFATSPTAPLAHTEGRVYWNATDRALNVMTEHAGVTVQVGQETLIRVKNVTGATISNGRAVYATGASSGWITIATSSNDAPNNAEKTIGLTTNDIADGQIGYCTVIGRVRDVDTHAWPEGTTLWLGMDGALTSTEPTYPLSVIRIGVVAVSDATAGAVQVRVLSAQIPTVAKQLGRITGEPTGFEDPSGMGCAYDYTARTITLTHSSGFIKVWWHGTQYTLGTSPWTSDPHDVTAGVWFLGVKTNGAVSWTQTGWDFATEAMIASAYYNPTIPLYIGFKETHGMMPWQAHLEFHERIGAYKRSGGTLTAGTYTLQGNTDAANTPGVDQSVIVDEDLNTTLPATLQGSYTRLYFTGSGTPNFELAQTGIVRIGTNYPKKNVLSTTWSEAELGSGDYANLYLFAVPVSSEAHSQAYRYFWLEPQFSYSSLALAQAESLASISLGQLAGVLPEIVALARITIRCQSSYAMTGKFRLEALQYITVGASPSAATPNPAAVAVTFTPAGNIAATNVQAAIEELDTEKEPAITGGLVSQFWSGLKTWRDLATDVRTSALTGYAIAANSPISATDTVLGATQKLEGDVAFHTEHNVDAVPGDNYHYSDGSTAGRCNYCIPAMALAGKPLSLLCRLPAMASNPSASTYLAIIGASIANTSATSTILYIVPEGTLYIQARAGGSNYRNRFVTNFRSLWMTRARNLLITFTPDATDPVVLVQNDAGGYTALAIAVADIGTPPATWMNAELVSTYINVGLSWPAGVMPNVRPIIGTFTPTDFTEYLARGRVPIWAAMPGNAAPIYTSDFSAGADSCTGTRATITGNVDGVTDGTTSKDNCLQATMDSTPANNHYAAIMSPSISAARTTKPNTKIRITGEYYTPSANTVGTQILLATSSARVPNQSVNLTLSVRGVWTTFDVQMVTNGTLLAYFTNGTTSTLDGNGTDTFYLRSITVTQCGTISEISPRRDSQISDDLSGNSIIWASTTGITSSVRQLELAGTATPLPNGTATSGISRLYAREDHVHSNLLTGYAIADSTIISASDTVIGALQKLDARIDEAAYQLQAGAAELAIPLSYTGTGAGVLTMRLFSDIAQTATIDGAGKFYTDAAGTLNEATSYAMAANAWTTFYIKVPSSTCTMRVPSGRAIRYFGSSTNPFISETANGPKVNGLATTKIRQSNEGISIRSDQDLSIVSGTTYPWLNATRVYFVGNSLTVSGQTYPWLNATQVYFNGNSLTVSGTTYPWLNATQVYFVGNLLTVSGQTYPWLNATQVYFSGASLTVSGTTYPWLNATQVYFSGASLTVSGQTYPWLNASYVVFNGTSLTVSGTTYPWLNAAYVYFNGTSLTVSGTTYPWLNATRVYFSGNLLTTTANLSESVLYSGASSFELYVNSTGMAVSYPTTRAWPRNISRMYVRPATGSMVSADVDRILIDIASTANLTAVGYKSIDLGGNCGAHTSASNAAIATLTGLGFAVTVN